MARLEAAAAELEALGLGDRDVFALTLYGEARGKGGRGIVAVAWVIWNRAAAGRRWGGDVWAVCLGFRQFSCWWPGGGKENHAAVMAQARAVAAGRPAAAFHVCRWIAEGFLSGWQGAMPDPTGGALWYYAPGAMVPRGAVPKHLRGIAPTAEITGHLFFDRSL